MRILSLRTISRQALPIVLASLLAGCQSPPSRLYVLNALAKPSLDAPAQRASIGASNSAYRPTVGPAPLVGVSVTLPDYLDSTDIVERTGDNELTPAHDAQWGESLPTEATRVIAENLAARLSAFDIVAMPSRSPRMLDYEVEVHLTRFEGDPAGNVVARGRWTITDAAGHELASARISRAAHAGGTGYGATAAAMSRDLMALSMEIAGVVEAISRRDGRIVEAEPRHLLLTGSN